MAVSRIIGCISAKGGVGKTTSAINLAAALNYFGKDVTLVDANLTSPNVGIYLGTPISPVTPTIYWPDIQASRHCLTYNGTYPWINPCSFCIAFTALELI